MSHSQSRSQSLLRYPCPAERRLWERDCVLSQISMRELVSIPRRELNVLPTESRNCLSLENIARSFSETRLVSRDIRFLWPIESNTAFLFACLNIHFSDRRIHFRFRYLASMVVQYLCQAFFIISELLPFIAGLVLWNSKRKCDWRHKGRNLNILVTVSKNPVGFAEKSSTLFN